MSLEHPLIAIVGSGAVGGYYGARLARRGFEVHFLLRSDYAVVRREGLRVRSREGDFVLSPAQVHACDDSRRMPKADLVIVALKATANHQFAPLIGPLLKEETAILTLQNGLGNEEQLAGLFGSERVLGGLAFVCINRGGPGVIQHTDYGLIRLGEFAGGPSARCRRIAEMFQSSGVPCQVLEDLGYGRWEKLVWNVPFNSLGAIMDLSTDRLMGSQEGVDLVRSIMQEVVAGAHAVGAALPEAIIDINLDRTRTMGPYRSSMQIDRQLSRPMEIEAIVGNPMRAAQAHGVAVPRLEILYRLLCLLK